MCISLDSSRVGSTNNVLVDDTCANVSEVEKKRAGYQNDRMNALRIWKAWKNRCAFAQMLRKM